MDSYEIDKHRLDHELIRQPKMFHEAADKLASADSEVDRLKARLELVEAKVAMDVRENPSAFGLKRATEASIEAAVIMDVRYQKALAEFNRAKEEARHLRAEVNYLDQRKVVIEYLCKLRLADYFADPRISGDERQAGQEDRQRRVFEKTR